MYKSLLDLAYYTEDRIIKYPRDAKNSIGNSIKLKTYDCVENTIKAFKSYDKKEKLTFLYSIDVDLKMLCFLVRISKRNKYISTGNYAAWCRKIANVSTLLGGWIKNCQKA